MGKVSHFKQMNPLGRRREAAVGDVGAVRGGPVLVDNPLTWARRAAGAARRPRSVSAGVCVGPVSRRDEDRVDPVRAVCVQSGMYSCTHMYSWAHHVS